MADDDKPPASTGYGAVVDAGNRLVRTVTNSPAQGMMNLVVVLALVALIAVLGVKVWSEMDENRENRKERQETEAVRVRENNAREELSRQTGMDREEKVRSHCERENDKTRKEAAEQNKMILSTFLAEGDRQRTFIGSENEKFRNEVKASLKRPNDP